MGDDAGGCLRGLLLAFWWQAAPELGQSGNRVDGLLLGIAGESLTLRALGDWAYR